MFDQLHRLLGLACEVLELDLALAARLAVRVDDHPQVLGDGHAGDRDRVLEGHEEAGARALVGVGLGDVLALEA